MLIGIHLYITDHWFSVCPTACAGHCEDCIEDFQCNTCEPRFRLEDEQPIKCEGKQLFIPHCKIDITVHMMLITTTYWHLSLYP